MKKIIKEIFGKNVTYSVDTNNEARTNDSAYNAKRQGDMIIIRSNSIKIEKFDKKTPINSLRKNILENIRNIKEEHLQYIKCESEECQTFLKCDIHPLVQAVHTAYAYHLPLVLTPDMIWYCIASSIAVYIKDNSELLRDKFVDFDGKKSIDIRRDDFVFGSLDNCWHETVDEFSNQINENTKGGIAEKLIANFSTTTIVSKVSSQIVLMDAMQNYFEYTVMTMCCVPEIRLCGDKNDWISVKTKTNEIAQILPALNEWIKNLNEILQNFIDVYDDGEVRTDFWNRIYKRNGGSGGPFVSGWIIGLFPFLYGTDHMIQDWHNMEINSRMFKYALNQVPFNWSYHGKNIEMLFIGGLVGVAVESDSALKPVFGYAIAEDKKTDVDAKTVDSGGNQI